MNKYNRYIQSSGYSLCPAWLESTLICISLNLYLFNEFQSIYISINRFVAIYFPTHYNKLCGIWATVIIHLALFGNRLQNVVFETYERIKHENYISFSPDYLMFTAIEVGGTGMVVLFSLMFIVALSANIATFAKISIFYLKSGGNQDADNQRRVRMNIKLFFQTALQDFLFLLDNFFTFKLGGLINHRFWIFICATFVWQSVHVLDGLIMIMFNDRLSFLKKSLFTSSEAISKADSNSTFVKTWPNRTTNRDLSS
uniref:7TM_GPCR_Srx domain-containing protein n=1 Tax=Caenorhabditis japonica TaxID=281687 RepID=A0A8R1HN96_CAEJA